MPFGLLLKKRYSPHSLSLTSLGFSGRARPENPNEVSDKEWGEYLFFRSNPKGMHYERWTHDHGCRQWFNVQRHTVTDKIIQTYKMGEAKPEVRIPRGR